MANHPKRSRGPYTAELFGPSWAGNVQTFRTIREARAWAEEYGDTVDRCCIIASNGTMVAEYRRAASSGGWFRAEI